MKIGNIDLGEKPLFLAPMEDVTDPSFRYLCKHFGADVVYTEFVASEGLIRDCKKSFKKLELFEFERPAAIQLYGHQVDSMVEAAKMAEEVKPDFIDLNFGCPVKKIATRGAGAGMLRNIPLMLEMTEAIVNGVKTPVTVKTRLGWDNDSKIIVDLAERLQDTGIHALAIHGRTREQMYKGEADWTLIGEVKNNPRMKIPIIGNGDINGPETAKNAFDKFGVDAIMVGRATVGRPWIFKEIKDYLQTGQIMKPLTIKEKVELAKLHLQKSIEWKGDPRGILEIRRHLSNYFKGLPNFKETRIKLVTLLDADEILKTLNEIAERYGDIDDSQQANDYSYFRY
ncbi:MAG: tRNA dihydrouridine synthase DusB [Bacteroidetes bacterium GWF2_33_16]|nr:MAG: tRNA dihydrouridine synthase DusB [Bacteroidetes bacterium GWE2_32_14]OFY07741.1 MAG: tRNA dihydrouridine synthase DusB [Bacteroidetes bacterium GWF2_33_16]